MITLEGPTSVEDTIPVTPFPTADPELEVLGIDRGSNSVSTASSFSRISSNGYSNFSPSEKGDESDAMEEPTEIHNLPNLSDGEETDGSLLNG